MNKINVIHQSTTGIGQKIKQALAALLATALLSGVSLSTQAATITVDSLADTAISDGACTLREAISNSSLNNGGLGDCAAGEGAGAGITDVIDLTGLSGTITITSSNLPAITESLTINGPGAANLSIDGNNLRSCFSASGNNQTFSVNNLTITQCYLTGFGAAVGGSTGVTLIVDAVTLSNNVSGTAGAAIYANAASAVTVTNSLFDSNSAQTGGAVYVRNTPGLTISGSTFTNNTMSGSTYSGGALYVYGATTNTTIENSLFEGNSASTHGGAIGIDNTSSVTMRRVTMNNNTTYCKDEVITRADSAGMKLNYVGVIDLTNVTISNNQVVELGTLGHCALVNGAALIFGANVSGYIGNMTVYGNSIPAVTGSTSAGLGLNITAPNSVEIANSLFAANSFGGLNKQNCYFGNVIDGGNNLDDGTTCGFALSNTDPLVGTVDYHSGSIKTLPIKFGSPAIDAGNPAGCVDGAGAALLTDARGASRSVDGDDVDTTATCDIGAYEFGAIGAVRVVATSSTSVTEANANIGLQIVRFGNLQAFDIDLDTADGTATAAGLDYTIKTNNTLTWAATVDGPVLDSVSLLADTTIETNETFTVGLVNTTIAGVDVSDPITVTILDDDLDIEITTADAATAENDIGTVNHNIVVSLSKDPNIDGVSVDIPFTVSGTATLTDDYTVTASPLTVMSGTVGVITVSHLGDQLAESNETVVVTLGKPSHGRTVNKTSYTLTINDDDAAPSFISATTANVDENTTAVMTLSATDIDGPAITFSLAGGAGADQSFFSVSGTALSFTSAPDFENKLDSDANNVYQVEVVASDGFNSTTQLINVTVVNVNEAPVITEGVGTTVVMSEDGSPIPFNLTLNATDADAGDTITWSISSGASNGSAVAAGTGTSKVISYTPNANFNGNDTFFVQVSDGNGGTDTIKVNVTVSAVNDAPVITEGVSTTVVMSEDSTPTAFSLTLNATDAEADIITWSIVSAASNGSAVATGTGASKVISYTPNANFSGNDSFFVQVSDGNGGTDTITVNVTVNAINDAPIITEGVGTTVVMSEDGLPTPFNLTLNATDADATDTLTWSISSAASNGSAVATGTGASKVISYTPAANYSGSDSFIVQVSDGNGGTDTFTVNVTVNAVNDAPVITEGASTTVVMSEDSTPTVFSLILNATDVEADTITWSISSAAGNGSAVATGTGASKVISYTPTANYAGSDSFIVQVSDGNGGTDTITVNVTVTAANDAPTLTGTAVTSAIEGQLYSFTATGNDIDAGETLTYSLSNAPTWLSVNASGVVSGTPARADVGSATAIVVSVTDAGGLSDSLAAFDITTEGDFDLDGIIDSVDTDDDNDGVIDVNDVFPLDSSETTDTDGDGIGNNADTDDDNDGVGDSLDSFPLDAAEQYDTDGDGIGNNADLDDDGDGVLDINDAFPLGSTESVDTDGDGIGDNADTDDDNDGVADVDDAFPLDPLESIDTDGDGLGNTTDNDDDGDGVLDVNDVFPLDATESADTDADGIGNNADTDDDADGVLDINDAFPLDATESVDTDGDGIGNNADTDDDADGVLDVDDAFPLDATKSAAASAGGGGGSLGLWMIFGLLGTSLLRRRNRV